VLLSIDIVTIVTSNAQKAKEIQLKLAQMLASKQKLPIIPFLSLFHLFISYMMG